MARINLDLSGVNANGGFDTLVPPGMYDVRVISASLIPTRKGHAVKPVFTVISGEHEGAQTSDFLNIDNPSEKCVRIAQSRLKNLMEMGGHPNPGLLDDTDELIGLEMSIRLSQREDDKGYDVNEVQGYTKVQGQSVGAMKTRVENMTREEFPNAVVEEVPPARAKFPWEK